MKKYYFFDGTAQQGPFTFEELRVKNITPQTSIWFDPMPQWKPAGEIEELRSIFNTTAAPHPAATDEIWNYRQFYYVDSAGVRQGPVNLKQLEGKNITARTQVWYDPLPNWTTAGEIPALGNIINNPVTAPQTVAASQVEDWNNKQFYYVDSAGAQQGPVNLKQLEGINISANTAVWYDPLPKWTTAGKVDALKNIIAAAATVSHPAATPQTREEDWNNKQFYYMDSAGVRQGPLNLKQLEGKNISSRTSIWYDPLPKWTTAGEVAALKDVINKPVTVSQPAAATAAKEEDWANKQYFIADSSGAQQGPFSMEQLKGKNISPATLIWYPPLPKWTTAGEVAALKDIINTPPPIS